ncbi:MAG: hypothetical protein H6618_07900 [Deltaproteobacteria bacterium]|nr:hypothetical protein [Deltaproteobacteria bacterium]
MLISENLAHYDEILESRYPRLIAMPVQQQNLQASGLTTNDFNSLKENIKDRLILYYTDESRHLKTQYPILSLNVNTRDVHWETVIIDLNELENDPPVLEFEHWNFTGNRTSSIDTKKIQQIQQAVLESIEELSNTTQVKYRETKHNFKTTQRPDDSDVISYLNEYYRKAGSIKNSSIEIIMNKNKIFIKYQQREFPVQIARTKHTYFGDIWEVSHPHFYTVEKAQKLEELISQYKDIQRPDYKEIKNNSKNTRSLLQGTNNCGVASMWITEQRASGLSRSEVLKLQPNGYHKYRNEMLYNLYHKFKDTLLPESQIIAYPYPQYGPAKINKNMKEEKATTLKTPLSPPTDSAHSVIEGPGSTGKTIKKRSIFRRWWIPSTVAGAGIVAGYAVFLYIQDKQKHNSSEQKDSDP